MPCKIDGLQFYENAPNPFNVQMRRARKSYHCCECHSYIEPYTLYEVATGKWEGGWDEFKTCAACVEIRDKFMDGFTYGDIWEYLREECTSTITIADLEGMSQKAIAKIEEMLWEEAEYE